MYQNRTTATKEMMKQTKMMEIVQVVLIAMEMMHYEKYYQWKKGADEYLTKNGTETEIPKSLTLW